MTKDLLLSLSSIIFLGILAQWLAWRFKLPSILLLIIFGVVAGPFTGLVEPGETFNNILFPLVSLSVAVILFEGGLNLKITELNAVGGVVRNLIIIGIPATWVLSAAASYYILDIGIQYSILLGAILVVTGPTVILPILRHVRPVPRLNSILKWEGIINDPIGALFALLVFEVILATGFAEASTSIISGILKTVFISSAIGLGGGFIIIQLIKNEHIPEFLENSITLAAVIGVFTASNLIQKESGLFAVTIMGIYLANQRRIKVSSIIEFKENLRVILIGVLFILLSARLTMADILLLNWSSVIFVLVLILVIRPAAVFLSSIKMEISWQEKLYTSFMAPRGIVAAAVTSLFALELSEAGFSGTEILVPIMFLIIILTIAIYGLSAVPLAKWLKLASPNPEGCIILGANVLAREIGKELVNNSISVILVDTNWDNISTARMAGLNTHYGSILSDRIFSDIDLTGMGKLIALTPNREVNSLAVLRFSKLLGNSNVYQIKIDEDERKENENVSRELQGKTLFGSNYTYDYLIKHLEELEMKSTTVTDKFNYEEVKKHNKDEFIPLFIITKEKERTSMLVVTDKDEVKLLAGQTIIGLVKKYRKST